MRGYGMPLVFLVSAVICVVAGIGITAEGTVFTGLAVLFGGLAVGAAVIWKRPRRQDARPILQMVRIDGTRDPGIVFPQSRLWFASLMTSGAMFALAGAGMVAATINGEASIFVGVLGAVAALFFGGATILGSQRILGDHYVAITPDVVQIAQPASAVTVPWEAIAEIDTTEVQRRPFIGIRLRPEADIDQGLSSVLLVLGNRGFECDLFIDVSALICPPATLLSALNVYASSPEQRRELRSGMVRNLPVQQTLGHAR